MGNIKEMKAPKIYKTLLIILLFIFIYSGKLFAQSDEVIVGDPASGGVKATTQSDYTTLNPQATAPIATEGRFYYDDTANTIKYYNGTVWKDIRGGDDKYLATRVIAASNTNMSGRSADIVCDGVNDQADINAMISEITDPAINPSRSGAIYLLEGAYNISASIIIPSNVALIGAGRGSVLKLTAGLSSVNIIQSSASSGILISQLLIDGNDNTGGDNSGIYFNGVSFSMIERIWVENVKGAGIKFNSGSTYNTISDCHFQNNRGTAMDILNSSNNIITGNSVQSPPTTYDIIRLWNGSNNRISNNTLAGPVGIGIYFGGGNIVSSNNITGQGTASGIYLTAGTNFNIISGNNILNESQCINLYGVSNNAISNNNLKDCNAVGIQMVASACCDPPNSNNIVIGNILYNMGQNWGGTGISISKSDNTLIASNRIYNPNNFEGTQVGIEIPLVASPATNTYLSGNLISGYFDYWADGAIAYIVDNATTQYTDKMKLTFERASSQNISDGGTVLVGSYSYIPLNPSVNVTLNATTAVNNGRASGDLLILENISSTRTLTIPHNANTILEGAASKALAQYDSITLIWNGTDWVQTAYTDIP